MLAALPACAAETPNETLGTIIVGERSKDTRSVKVNVGKKDEQARFP
jgi:hypothetical protein